MSMKRRAGERQEELWVPTTAMASAPGNPFYRKLNELLRQAEFDRKVEDLCAPLYGEGGRPSIPPGIYMRMLMVGYFEGIDSERGIAWRCADSLSLKEFLGYRPQDSTPNHSSLSRIRTRLDGETHRKAFNLVLTIVAEKGLLDGKALGVDSTTMEANAALRSIVRRDDGRGYEAFLQDVAREAGVEEPTRQDLARIDRKRPKKGSNVEWKSPADPEARITKMKDGSTHLAHAAEHAVDMKSGAIVSATIQDATAGDPTTMLATMKCAMENLCAVLEDPECDAELRPDVATEWIADKGYHANDTLEAIASLGARSFISEPKRGKRRWRGKDKARAATYANRSRIAREKGKAHLRRRGEFLERSFAHTMESGAMRRAHLRGHSNISKRYLIHTAAFNLGLVMRSMFGKGTPRGLHGLGAIALARVGALAAALAAFTRWQAESEPHPRAISTPPHFTRAMRERQRRAGSSTAC